MNGPFHILLVALGGAVGAVLRYGMSSLLSQGEGIQWGTFAVNFIGCFLICFVFFKFTDIGQATKLFLFIGVFGGFTTMSSVSLEIMGFFAEGQMGYAFSVFLLNAAVCFGAGFLGRAAALVS